MEKEKLHFIFSRGNDMEEAISRINNGLINIAEIIARFQMLGSGKKIISEWMQISRHTGCLCVHNIF